MNSAIKIGQMFRRWVIGVSSNLLNEASSIGECSHGLFFEFMIAREVAQSMDGWFLPNPNMLTPRMIAEALGAPDRFMLKETRNSSGESRRKT
jgi:hypothetical protein